MAALSGRKLVTTMNKNVKRIYFTHYELLELMAITRANKAAAMKNRNKAEAALVDELSHKLQKFDVDANGAYLLIDAVTRYSLWLCTEKYISFCADQRHHEEYALAVGIAAKLSDC